jgi:hypothetical protein
VIQSGLAVSSIGIPSAYFEMSTETGQSHYRVARELASQWHVRGRVSRKANLFVQDWQKYLLGCVKDCTRARNPASLAQF